MARRRLPLAAAVLRVAAPRRRLRHRRLHRRSSPSSAISATSSSFVDEAHKRGMRVITDLVMNHTSDQHPWFQASRHDPEGPYGDFYVWADDDDQLPGRPDHLRRHRGVQLDLRPGPRAVLLAPLLLPPAGPQLREPGRPGRDAGGAAVLAGPRHRRVPAGRGAVPVRAGGHELREPAARPTST